MTAISKYKKLGVGILAKAPKEEQKTMVAVEEEKNDKQRAGFAYHLEKHLLKKYRTMIKSGVLLPAVEQTARMDGVDPAVLSDPDFNKNSEVVKLEPLSQNEDNRIIKKYKLMFKSGVPIAAIRSMAQRELGYEENNGFDDDLLISKLTT